MSLRAIESLHFCAVQLANGRVCHLSRDTETVVTFTDDEKRIHFYYNYTLFYCYLADFNIHFYYFSLISGRLGLMVPSIDRPIESHWPPFR